MHEKLSGHVQDVHLNNFHHQTEWRNSPGEAVEMKQSETVFWAQQAKEGSERCDGLTGHVHHAHMNHFHFKSEEITW